MHRDAESYAASSFLCGQAQNRGADGRLSADPLIIGACLKRKVLHAGHIQMTMHCLMTPHKQHSTNSNKCLRITAKRH